jgi:hypothetical protein
MGSYSNEEQLKMLGLFPLGSRSLEDMLMLGLSTWGVVTWIKKYLFFMSRLWPRGQCLGQPSNTFQCV